MQNGANEVPPRTWRIILALLTRLLAVFTLVKNFRITLKFRILRLTSMESQPQNAELGQL